MEIGEPSGRGNKEKKMSMKTMKIANCQRLLASPGVCMLMATGSHIAIIAMLPVQHDDAQLLLANKW